MGTIRSVGQDSRIVPDRKGARLLLLRILGLLRILWILGRIWVGILAGLLVEGTLAGLLAKGTLPCWLTDRLPLTSEGRGEWRQFADAVHEWSAGVHRRFSAQRLRDTVPELAARSLPQPEDAESLGLPIPDSQRGQPVSRIRWLQRLA